MPMDFSRYPFPQLQSLGWTEIHQSDLNALRSCRMEFRLSLLKRNRSSTLNAFMGTMFDRMLEQMFKGEDASIFRTPRGWRPILEEEFTSKSQSQTIWAKFGEVEDPSQVMPYLLKVHESGESLASLGKTLQLCLEENNLVPLRFQTRLVYGCFVGTRDLLCLDTETGKLVLIDLKTYGLWTNWLYNKGITKQAWDPIQITWNPQLRHYAWMARESGESETDEYAILCPTNHIPFTMGPQKNQRRGKLLFRAPAAPLDGYESDLMDTLCSFADRQPRDYPGEFGKLKCPTCRFRAPCLEGASVDVESSTMDEYEEEA